MKDYPPFDLTGLNTYSVHDRQSKVTVDDLAKTVGAGATIKEFLDALPNQFMGNDFPELVQRVGNCYRQKRPVILGMGAHVIKVGLSPLLIDMMDRNIITGMALNGAGIVHDTELAMVGRTSEDVDQVLGSGAFGAAKETGEFINAAINNGSEKDLGLGSAIGKAIIDNNLPYTDLSLTASAYKRGIPLTVHVAVGTDIIHIHPSACGASTGKTSHLDFRIFCSMVADLEGGAYLNIGSAVLLPEIFLKALTAVRNLGNTVDSFTTANFDFIRHYRPMTNVVNRPTASGGKGFNITGHHEIMVPLFIAALLDEIQQ